MGKLKKKEKSSIFNDIKHSNFRDFTRWAKETYVNYYSNGFKTTTVFNYIKSNTNQFDYDMVSIAKNSYLPYMLKQTMALCIGSRLASTPLKKTSNPYWKLCKLNTYEIGRTERMELAHQLEKYGVVPEIHNSRLRRTHVEYSVLLCESGYFLHITPFGFAKLDSIYAWSPGGGWSRNIHEFMENYKKGVLWELYNNMSPIEKLRYKLLKVFNPKKVEI